ncbi:hypothetical protein [Nitrobacter sp.]|uniref:hypothetical protein n=1 Tax=Nitrobacter sp. TaxID=29420 RepID=UPI0029CAB8EC|nr:hypothetical protein [Nitrobacter sp.]
MASGKHTGEVGILNVGHGDTKLSFDSSKPAELEHARRVVTEMLRMGFAIMVQIGEKDGKAIYTRAEAFDEKTDEYIIMGTPESFQAANAMPQPPAKMRRAGKRTSRVPAASTRAVSVARSAGG